ncbi:hypothetical protein HDA32_000719 [Spinactinospora alkalitolerans]|uniref:Uncharacterized protein n=1 Tax=Spinactinospora alkalitolerans TaxID=687207 RepID=A0A852TNP7_9ACTN|nr:hypothetical protein [Spinactinospora alkalitolerans]NYE45599.1 hypothetical protein [Spinactinospora alkalitolerans]
MNAAALQAASGGVLADTVTPGVLGFVVIAAIAAALYFLMKSMRKRMGNVNFDEGTGPASGGENAEQEPNGSKA